MSARVRDDQSRNIVPRWREATTAAAMRELDAVPDRAAQTAVPPADARPRSRADRRRASIDLRRSLQADDGSSSKDAANDVPPEVAQRVAEWRAQPTVGTAADALSAAFVHRTATDDTRAAARFVHDHAAAAGEFATALAARFLAEHFPNGSTRPSDALSAVVDTVALLQHASTNVTTGAARHASTADLFHGAQIRRLRRRVQDDPRNAFAWTDLARLYTTNGQSEAANRAMRAALAVGGSHRFVLRSASRFFLHSHDPEQAHAVLRRAPALTADPWLIAAEVGVASAIGIAPRSVRAGREVLGSGRLAPFHTNELASALATLEARDGRTKVARALFEQALRAPSDNTVAQAEWASRRLRVLELPPGALETPRSYEARARDACQRGLWGDALAACVQWSEDEPFSTRAIGLATTLAGPGRGDFIEAAYLAGRGLIASPRDPLLRNNLVFSLAHAGRTPQARQEYDAWSRDARTLAGGDRVAWLATGGLLAFREGQVDDGRLAYEAAVAAARDAKLPQMVQLAVAYWAAEEALAGAPDEDLDSVTATLKGDGSPIPVELALAIDHLLRTRVHVAARAALQIGVRTTADRSRGGPSGVHVLGGWSR